MAARTILWLIAAWLMLIVYGEAVDLKHKMDTINEYSNPL